MRVIIAGGRNYKFTEADIDGLDFMHRHLGFSAVLCGMATGADMEGKQWAESRGIPVEEYPAKWNEFGRAAGPMRNKEMAENADMLIPFPGGRGTENMIKQAMECNLVIPGGKEMRDENPTV